VRRLAFAALLLCATQAAAQSDTSPWKSDWERSRETIDWQEGRVVLPPLPRGELIEFFVSSATSFKFFIDPQSLSVGADGAVRYTMVVLSPSGARTVSYEGMRCGQPALYRSYAFEYRDTWMKNTRADWRPVEPKAVQRWHNVLAHDFFCPNFLAIRTPAEGLEALRDGRHSDLPE